MSWAGSNVGAARWLGEEISVCRKPCFSELGGKNLGIITNVGITAICHRCRKGAASSLQVIWGTVTGPKGGF